MSSTSANAGIESTALNGYSPVNVVLLRHVPKAPVDIFIQLKRGHQPALYCRAGMSTANARKLSLNDTSIREFCIRNEDFERFGASLMQSIVAQQQDSVTPVERFAAIQLAVSVEAEHAARLVDCGKLVKLSQKVASELVSIVANDDVLPRDLFRIARHDFNTFTHVTNVAGYCVLLATRMGISDKQELLQIATAGLLHDIGKRFISPRILTKRGKLTPLERELIELHPTRGYEELCGRPDMNVAQLMMVYQHHEWLDGNGYPVGIREAEIHPWARMLSVVDVFDALTGTRPYRRRATARDAMRYIELAAGTQFDLEIAKCWISSMNEA